MFLSHLIKSFMKEDFKTASESGYNDEVSVFQVRGMYRETHGNASFNKFLKHCYSPQFSIRPCILRTTFLLIGNRSAVSNDIQVNNLPSNWPLSVFRSSQGSQLTV